MARFKHNYIHMYTPDVVPSEAIGSTECANIHSWILNILVRLDMTQALRRCVTRWQDGVYCLTRTTSIKCTVMHRCHGLSLQRIDQAITSQLANRIRAGTHT